MAFIDACSALLDEKIQVVALTAPTGSGKTIEFPLQAQRATRRPVIVVNPLRVTTQRSAERCSEVAGSPLGQLVGCRYGGHCTPPRLHPYVEYITSGCFLQKARRESSLDNVTIVIDEADNGSIASDLIMMVLRSLLRMGGKFQVVLTSATMELDQLFWQGTRVAEVNPKP